MRPRPSEMAQDFIVVASEFVQGIGEDRHSVECSVVVDGLGQFDHGSRLPGWIDGGFQEKSLAQDFPDQTRLRKKFSSLGAEQGIIGNPGLGATGSISGSYFWARGGCIPGRLASGIFTSKTGGT